MHLDWLEMESAKEQTMLYEQVAQRVTSILVDETLTFSNKNHSKMDKDSRNFWKTCMMDVPKNTANVLLEILSNMSTNYVKLSKQDYDYISQVVITDYLESRLVADEVKRQQAENKDTKVEESKTETNEETIDTTHAHNDKSIESKVIKIEVIESLREKLATIGLKKESKGDSSENVIGETHTDAEVAALNEKIGKLLSDPDSLETLEAHISEIYNQQSVTMDDYKACSRILNDIEQALNESDFIYQKYGKLLNHSL